VCVRERIRTWARSVPIYTQVESDWNNIIQYIIIVSLRRCTFFCFTFLRRPPSRDADNSNIYILCVQYVTVQPLPRLRDNISIILIYFSLGRRVHDVNIYLICTEVTTVTDERETQNVGHRRGVRQYILLLLLLYYTHTHTHTHTHTQITFSNRYNTRTLFIIIYTCLLYARHYNIVIHTRESLSLSLSSSSLFPSPPRRSRRLLAHTNTHMQYGGDYDCRPRGFDATARGITIIASVHSNTNECVCVRARVIRIMYIYIYTSILFRYIPYTRLGSAYGRIPQI
jgi:hypothetical protein